MKRETGRRIRNGLRYALIAGALTTAISASTYMLHMHGERAELSHIAMERLDTNSDRKLSKTELDAFYNRVKDYSGRFEHASIEVLEEFLYSRDSERK